MTCSVTLACPGCQTKNQIVTNYPTPTGKTTEHVHCSLCRSLIFAQFKRDPKTPRSLKIQMKLKSMSHLLAAILAERALQEKRAAN